jgi:hypothetical protein
MMLTKRMHIEYGEEVPMSTPPLLFLLLSLTLGCAQDVLIDQDIPARDPSKNWRKVIKKATKSGTGVDYDFIARRPKPLAKYLAWVAEHGQHSDHWGESKEDRRIAHLANAHNAMLIHQLLQHRPLDSPDDVQIGLFAWPGAGLSRGVRYRLDGEHTSLHKLQTQLTVSRYQDPMLWLLFHDGTAGSPPLRWWPDKGLQTALKNTLRTLLTSKLWLAPTQTGWAAHPIFFEHEEDFIEWDDTASLCDWLAPYAAGEGKDWLKAHAEDCPLERIEPARRLNQAEG